MSELYDHCVAYFITILQMEVTWFRMIAKINPLPVLTYDVLSPRILIVTTCNKLLHSKHMYMYKSHMTHDHMYLSMLNGVTTSGKVRFCAIVRGTPT